MIIYAPHDIVDKPKLPIIFLAGSIEMGRAEPWQDRAAAALEDKFLVLNPRRPDWNSNWKQGKNEPQFREQVEWELTGQEVADFILMYFDKDTQSPIALMELGLFALEEGKMVVVCPEGFWRKGNVDIVCERYGVMQMPTLDEAIAHLNILGDSE